MRIAFVINSLQGGGAERVASTLANHFAEEGHAMTIVTFGDSPIEYELAPEIEVHALRSGAFLRGPARLMLLPILALELARYLNRIQPDATLSFLTRANIAHVLTRRFGNERRIYISERTSPQADYVGAKRLMGALVKRTYPSATGIIAVSDGARRGLEGLGIPRSKTVTIHNPIDLAQMAAASAAGSVEAAEARAAGRPFRIVMAGRLAPPKDYATLLEALAVLVRNDGLDVRLVVLGKGPDETVLRERARVLGVAEHVEWRGWVTNVAAALATCDACTFASSYEGFPNVLVEAMACGLPVVSSDCPSGPAEILEGGKYGFLVPVGDAAAIAAAVRALATDSETYADYKQRAIAGAARFDVGGIAKQYLDFIAPASARAARHPDRGSPRHRGARSAERAE